MDLQKRKFEIDIANKTLTLEVSRLAEQANGAVLATYGGTVVLATAVMTRSDKDVDFMPLTVDFEEKYYASGKILGSQYVRRETKPSEDAILSGRLVDRAIRPLFDERLRRGIQVTTTVLSYDEENNPDFVAVCAASTALHISDIPWNGPIAGLNITKIGDDLIFNPENNILLNRASEKVFSSFIAGTGGKLNMIELEGVEAKESDIISAYKLALPEVDRLINFIRGIRDEIGKPKENIPFKEIDTNLINKVNAFLSDKLEKAVYVVHKKERELNIENLKKDLITHLLDSNFKEEDLSVVDALLDKALDQIIHKNILENDRRPDGRKLDEIRDLHAEVSFLPRAHGSSLFIRGNTQSLAVTTLASPGSEKVVEAMKSSHKERFMLQYNFPGYSVGEASPYKGPGRRDIGHGALALKAVSPMVPGVDEFPYVIRVVSEIMSSNGSSSMATVCSSSLSLMDAGVPMKKPVAGIAMGLVSDENKYKILTDIQGPEDHYGDMDFKVAGTDLGVNAIQMDVKISGVQIEALSEGLTQAKKARLQILEVMNGALSRNRDEVSKYAPKIMVLDINPERIGEIIGPGGRVINGIIKKTGAAIDIDDVGKVFVSGSDHKMVASAMDEIKSILREYKVGEIVEGVVVKTLEFGAIVDLGGGRDGMIHVSELKNGFVKNVTDVLKVGDHTKSKIVKVEGDKIGLSIKQLQPDVSENKAEKK